MNSTSFTFQTLFHSKSSKISKTSFKMKAFVAVLALVAVAQAGVIAPAATTLLASPAATTLLAAPVAKTIVAAPTIARVPSLDSAVITSDRVGGNFAYSVSEAHAHAVTTPVIQHVASPVAVSYSAPSYAYASPYAHTVVAGAPLGYSGLVGNVLLK